MLRAFFKRLGIRFHSWRLKRAYNKGTAHRGRTSK
jgi:hypothetical protein